MPRALSSREVVWTAPPSDTYRTGKTKFAAGIHPPYDPDPVRVSNSVPRRALPESACLGNLANSAGLEFGPAARKLAPWISALGCALAGSSPVGSELDWRLVGGAAGAGSTKYPPRHTGQLKRMLGLEHVRRQLRKGAALALGQRDVPGQPLELELVDHVHQAVRGGVHVRVVDLVRVAGEDDLGVVADAGDDGLHLVRREVLRLVDDDVLVGDAAAADVRERLDGYQPQVDQLAVAAPRLLVGAGEAHEELDVVVDGLHPGIQLLLDRAGEEADV